MPRYVTESGYEEFEEVRTRVGHEPPLPQKIWLVDVANAGVRELKYDTLPGIADDPLADLRTAAGKQPLEGNRAVRTETDGAGHGTAVNRSAAGRHAALLGRAADNNTSWKPPAT